MHTDAPIDITPPPHFEIFWEEHSQKVIAAVSLFILVLFLIGGILLWNRSARLAADALLSTSHGMKGWQAVVAAYPHSGAAANALLLIAGTQSQEHNYDASNATYSRFSEQFPHYPLAISALLGRASNDDSTGHPEQAIDELQQAASTYPQSYGAPVALLLKARILARLNKKEESLRVLQLISSQYPDSLVNTVVLKQSKGL